MRTLLLALAVAALAPPAPAQIAFSRGPGGTTTCGAVKAMDAPGRVRALGGIEPVGGELANADPALLDQWVSEVDRACGDDRDRSIEDAAARALGGNAPPLPGD
jgi:hypothetical protein